MYKKVLMIFLSFLTLLFILTSFGLKSVSASNLNFIVLSTKSDEYKGVNHTFTNAKVTNDTNVESNQNINVFSLGEDIEVVNWSYLNNGKYSLHNTLEIAKNFEIHNPGFEVIAGVNGDYFSKETINANILYGNRVINPINHLKYQSLEFNLQGRKAKINKTLSKNQYLSLSVYDNQSNSLLFKEPIKKLNDSIILKDSDTSLFINGSSIIYKDDIKYFEIVDPIKHVVSSHVYIEGDVKNQVASAVDNMVIATKNENLIKLLETKPRIKVQNDLSELPENNMVIGFDGTILENSTVKEFTEMTGQNDANNKNRHPRTGFGFDSNGDMKLLTVDGRGAGGSLGVNLREFGHIMKNFDIVDGYNLDGGGSTQAIFKKDGVLQIVNNNNESNPYRLVGNALLFVKRAKSADVNVKINDNNLIVNLDNVKNDEIGFNLILNGEVTSFENKKKIEVALPSSKYVSIAVESVIGNNKTSIYNDYLEVDFEEPKVYPDITISHKINGSILEIYIKYEDPNRLIDSIRVKNISYDIDVPALVENATTRKAQIKNFESKMLDELVITVKYKDNFVDDVKYQPVHGNSNKITVIIMISSIIIVLLSGIIVFFTIFAKKNRKRLH